jgi:hypothetical protein
MREEIRAARPSSFASSCFSKPAGDFGSLESSAALLILKVKRLWRRKNFRTAVSLYREGRRAPRRHFRISGGRLFGEAGLAMQYGQDGKTRTSTAHCRQSAFEFSQSLRI